jgi:hypothetical protein
MAYKEKDKGFKEKVKVDKVEELMQKLDEGNGNIEDAWFSPVFLEKVSAAALVKAAGYTDQSYVFCTKYRQLSDLALTLAGLIRERGGDN